MFPSENVAKVGAAVGTFNLRSHAVRVGQPLHCTGDFIVEAWPATVGFKLVFASVQFSAASFADIGAFFPESVVFACKRHFCAFVNDYLFLFGSEFFEVGLFLRS